MTRTRLLHSPDQLPDALGESYKKLLAASDSFSLVALDSLLFPFSAFLNLYPVTVYAQIGFLSTPAVDVRLILQIYIISLQIQISFAGFYCFCSPSSLQISAISQYPFLGEPCRIRIPYSFSFFIFASILRLATFICRPSFTAESRLSFFRSSMIFFCVSFNSILLSFSDVSPMLLRCFSVVSLLSFFHDLIVSPAAQHSETTLSGTYYQIL